MLVCRSNVKDTFGMLSFSNKKVWRMAMDATVREMIAGGRILVKVHLLLNYMTAIKLLRGKILIETVAYEVNQEVGLS